jgi:hypothetical protein
MIKSTDSRKKKYSPQKHRGLEAALIQTLGREFPRLGGPRMLGLCTELILEVVDTHIVSTDKVGHGQVLWCAIDADDIPRRGKTAVNTKMNPVILNLFHPDDLEKYLARTHSWAQIQLQRMIRLCQEAHQQGSLLSGVDLSLLLGIDDAKVASMLAAYERENDQVVPRRATLHDMGSGVTHKRIICRKRYLEGKDPHQVGRETYHTLEAVDRYLGQYDRVRHCRSEGLTPQETAHILACGERLVHQYLEIDDQINEARKSSNNQTKHPC